MYACMYVYIYIYVCVERERDVHTYMHIPIYIVGEPGEDEETDCSENMLVEHCKYCRPVGHHA